MHIHLKGYYGYENLGDDLLLLSSYRLIKEKYPSATVFIRSTSSYIQDLIPEINLVKNYKDLPPIDVLVYGGGGVFFDFNKGNSKTLNKLVTIVGFSIFNKIVSWVKPASKLKILGWGLGIGPYSNSSDLFLKEMYHLSRFAFLGVRDAAVSYPLAKKTNKKNTYLFTDIVFNEALWLQHYTIQEKNLVVTIVPRGWEFKDKEFRELTLAKLLVANGIAVKFLFFNPSKDKECIKQLETTNFVVHLYRPKTANLFLSELKSSSLIITQRAHGAIVGNVLGIPSICIGIEPKLKNVHQMMPNSTAYVNLDYNLDNLVSLVKNELNTQELKSNVKKDNSINKKKVQELQKLLNEI